MIERAELPVQRNRTLKIFSAMTISPIGTPVIGKFSTARSV